MTTINGSLSARMLSMLGDVRSRLLAIFAADAAGYSRLMSVDDHGTLLALDAARAVFAEQITVYGGRLIDTAGDSVLAAFDTAAGAVSAALSVQQKLAAAAAHIPEQSQMRFRIGVHLGDVIEKGGGVYGDGVNIASRLQGLAAPGSIVISEAVRGSVRNRVNASFKDLGAQEVKNIAEPVRAFEVTPASAQDMNAARHRAADTQRPGVSVRQGWLLVGLLVIGAAVTGVVYWVRSPASDVSSAPLLSIAVLPFKPGTSATSELTAHTFSQSLVTGLTRTVLGNNVVSADAAAEYNRLGDVRALGKELNVRYVVKGDIRREGGDIAVALQLIEPQSRAQAWAARIESPGDSLELASLRTLAALRSALYRTEGQRLADEPDRAASALELAFRGLFKVDARAGKESFDKAKRLCEAALLRDPNLSAALLCKARMVQATLFSPDPFAAKFSTTVDPKRLAELEELTRHAVAADADNSVAWNARADALRWQHRWEATEEARSRALKLDGSRTATYEARAWDLIYMGQPEEALSTLAREAEVSPDVQRGDGYQSATCRAQLVIGRYDDAINSCEKAAGGAGNEDAGTQIFLAVAYAHRGDATKALAARDRALSLLPGLTIKSWKTICAQFSDRPEYWRQQELFILPGMRQARFLE